MTISAEHDERPTADGEGGTEAGNPGGARNGEEEEDGKGKRKWDELNADEKKTIRSFKRQILAYPGAELDANELGGCHEEGEGERGRD